VTGCRPFPGHGPAIPAGGPWARRHSRAAEIAKFQQCEPKPGLAAEEVLLFPHGAIWAIRRVNTTTACVPISRSVQRWNPGSAVHAEKGHRVLQNMRCPLPIFSAAARRPGPVDNFSTACNARPTETIDCANPFCPGSTTRWRCKLSGAKTLAINLRDTTDLLPRKDYSPVHSASIKTSALLSGFHMRMTRNRASARAKRCLQSSASRSRALTVTCIKQSIVRAVRSSR
jgi:hypothetical protein